MSGWTIHHVDSRISALSGWTRLRPVCWVPNASASANANANASNA
ncbi:hypothetical protein QIS74_01841 [Colletotrichum tabaci]|uniref:Uncharacterized protein n=1 Tax=Colletotrichum tabaci TaxID=1209068 RepID=A0AAV9TUP9_9PEZI